MQLLSEALVTGRVARKSIRLFEAVRGRCAESKLGGKTNTTNNGSDKFNGPVTFVNFSPDSGLGTTYVSIPTTLDANDALPVRTHAHK